MANPIIPAPTPAPKSNVLGTSRATKNVLGSARATKNVLGTGVKVTTIRPKVTQPAKKVDNSPLGAALSFGQSLIDIISTPMYFVEGAVSGIQDLSKKIGTGQELTPEDFAQPTLKAIGNAGAWTRGEKTITGSDILKTAGLPSNFWTGLAADILFDPLTYTPGIIVKQVLKGAGIAAKTGIKATKAASNGAVSAKVAVNAGVVAPDVIVPLREGASLLTQYSRKPLVKQNLMRPSSPALAARQEKLTSAIADKYTYKTFDPSVTGAGGRGTVKASEVIASGLEAAKKSFSATYLAERAKYDLGKIVKQEGKVARKEAGIAARAIGVERAAAEQVLKGAPKIIDNGVEKTMEAYVPHKTPKDTIVLDSKNIIHTFASKKQADAWVKVQTGAAPKATTSGPIPVVDAVPLGELDQTLGDMSLMSMSFKTAEKTLNTVNKLVAKATGVSAVSGATGAVGAVLKGAADRLPVERKYDSFLDLIDGLRAGDQVNLGVLEKIVKALDPESKLISQVEKGLSKADTYSRIVGVLIAKGPQTLLETERRISFATPETYFKSDGMAMAEPVADYVTKRIEGDTAVTPDVFAVSRFKAEANVAAYKASEKGKEVFLDVLYSVNRGLFRRVDDIEGVLASPSATEDLSSVNDMYLRNTEGVYETKTKALLHDEFNQYGEAPILGSLLGMNRKRVSDRLDTLDPSPADLQAEARIRLPMMYDALLGGLGVRTKYSKKAIDSNGKKHYVYVTMGDVVELMSRGKQDDLLQRAMFPDTGKLGILKTDVLSTVGIGEAIRKIIELKDLGAPISKTDIASILRSRGTNQTKWSATYKAQVPKIAAELAEYLSKEDVVKAFQDIHVSRAKAAAEDILNSADVVVGDLFAILLNAQRANMNEALDSVAARGDLVRQFLNEFAYAAKLFKTQNGPEAESVFESMVYMFINNGSLAKLATDTVEAGPLIGSAAAKNVEEQRLFGAVMTEINGFFKQENLASFNGIGVQRLPFPSAATLEKVTNDLTEARGLFTIHTQTGPASNTAAAIAKWNTDLGKLQAKLNTARLAAWENGITTHHRLPNGKWIKSASYNQARAERMALEMDNGVVMTDTGVAQKAPSVDQAQAFPSHKKLSPAESKKRMEIWLEQSRVKQYDLAEGNAEDAARKVLDRLDEYQNLGLSNEEVYLRMFQEGTNQAFQDLRPKIFHDSSTVYNKNVTKQISEKMSGTAGRSTVKPLLNLAESSVFQGVSFVADYTSYITKQYKNAWAPAEARAKIIEATRHAISGVDDYAGIDPLVSALAKDISNLTKSLFGSKETSMFATLDKEALIQAFAKYQLNDEIGFINVRGLTPEEFNDLPEWLPFADIPSTVQKGTQAEKDFINRRKTFDKSGKDPLNVIMRMAQAGAHAKAERDFVMNFAVNFSAKAQGLTVKEAMDAGWVQIVGRAAGGTDLSRYLPKPEQGGLFPPDIAAEFMSANREWNKLFNDGSMPDFIKTSMEIVGLLKATQTILRPGHHITNAFGDFTTAILAGARDPRHMKYAAEIAIQFARDDIKAAWGKNQMTAKLSRTLQAFGKPGKVAEGITKEGKTTPAVIIYGKSGKAQKINFTIEELGELAKRRGMIIGDTLQDDIPGIYDNIMSAPNVNGSRKQLSEVVRSGLSKTTGKVTRPAGSIAAYYSNVSRMLTMMKVINSRAWGSIDEAMDAAALEVGRFHPDIKSLAATERKYPRLGFTYYTWLRVAHNALIDMALNHTAAMAIPFKVQYQQAEQAGFEPMSVGVPWGSKTETPNYLNYSVYGPTEMGPKGPIVYKRSILPMDVLDTWNFTYDPAYTMDENAFKALASAGRVLGKNVNLAAQPVVEFLAGTDMVTGKPSQVKDLQSVGEKMLNTIGTVGLLKGTGLYTPSNKGPTSTDPYDAYTRNMLLQNFLFGQKAQITDSNANIRNAQTEQAARNKAFMEKLLKQQEKK